MTEEICGICREQLRNEHEEEEKNVDGRLATLPCSREHTFHYECINEWSAIENSCPIDRTTYTKLFVFPATGTSKLAIEEPVISKRQKPVEMIMNLSDWDSRMEQCVCEYCHSGENEEVLLLCDRCEKAYHTYCLEVPLTSVPGGTWCCESCYETHLSNRRVRARHGRRGRRGISMRNVMNRCVETLLQSQITSRRKRARAAFFLQSGMRQGYQIEPNGWRDGETVLDHPTKNESHEKSNKLLEEIPLDEVWRQFDKLKANRESNAESLSTICEETASSSAKKIDLKVPIINHHTPNSYDIMEWAFGESSFPLGCELSNNRQTVPGETKNPTGLDQVSNNDPSSLGSTTECSSSPVSDLKDIVYTRVGSRGRRFGRHHSRATLDKRTIVNKVKTHLDSFYRKKMIDRNQFKTSARIITQRVYENPKLLNRLDSIVRQHLGIMTNESRNSPDNNKKGEHIS